jgi:3-isopropylmalate/(R)-2-methylmalate dehydratase large subunit
MTLVERILARASGRDRVEPDDIVVAEVDRLIMHDLSGYLTSKVFEERVNRPIAHPDRVIMVFDHVFSPARERDAEVLQANRAWARRHGIVLLDCGSGNIHNAVVHGGLIGPGMVVVGSDSHTPVHGSLGAFAAGLGNDSHAGTVMPYAKAWFRVPHTIRLELSGELRPGSTVRDVALWLTGQIGEGGAIYRALEFGGPFVDGLGLFSRWLLPLIAVDVGAKCGYIEPDEAVLSFARSVGALDEARWAQVAGDGRRLPAAAYEEIREYSVSEVGPQVACPPTVGNVKPVEAVAGTEIGWAEIGGHGGGRLADIRLAAQVLARRPKHPDVRLNIVPASRQVFAQALREGLVDQLHAAGATWFPPSTGSNQAVNMGAMAAGERMVSTHARNFPGRNGSTDAEMYLASALTVATSATEGRIADPREMR